MKEEDLKRLLDKYYDGTASESEEAELKKYFTSGDVIPGYEAETEIFGFYTSAAPVPEPSAGFESRIMKAVNEVSLNENRLHVRKIILPILSAAAGILMLAGLYFFLMNRKESSDTYSDPRIAYAETVRILRDVSLKMNSARASLQPVGKIYDVKSRSLGTLHKSASIIEKNLKPLGYLGGENMVNDSSSR